MWTFGIRQHDELIRAGDAAGAAEHLRAVLAPDVRLCIPDRLPYGGLSEGVDAVIEQSAVVRAAQLDEGDAEFLDDPPVVIRYCGVSWPDPDLHTLTAEWGYLGDDGIREIQLFSWDIGLIPGDPAPGTEIRSAPEQGVLRHGIRGNDRTESRDLVSAGYTDAEAGTDLAGTSPPHRAVPVRRDALRHRLASRPSGRRRGHRCRRGVVRHDRDRGPRAGLGRAARRRPGARRCGAATAGAAPPTCDRTGRSPPSTE